MSQVILENVYKSFSSRKGESVTSQTQSPLTLAEKTDLAPRAESVNVLRRINLTIADGEFMVLVGPSGCGKSTLLRLIAGLEVMTGGNIWVGDRLINDLPPKERDIAMVFQNYALYPHMTVYDNIAFGLRRTGSSTSAPFDFAQGKTLSDQGAGEAALRLLSTLLKARRSVTEEQRSRGENTSYLRTWAENLFVEATRNLPKGLRYISEKERAVNEQVRSVAQLLQIETLLNRLPKQLSGGQRQRVALGRAIARNPQVFLMDEPLSNLDAKLRAETRAQIVKLQRQLGTTTIYVTHDQTEAMTMGDRIAIMSEGKIQQVASPLELYNRPANLFVAEFIGSPPMNFIPVEFHAPQLIAHSQFRFTLPEVWAKALQKFDRKALILGIRPEHLNLSMPATKNLPVQVDLVENLGNDSFLAVKIAEPGSKPAIIANYLQVRIPPDRFVQPGEQLWLSLTPEKIHFFDPETELAIFPL
ncbi:MAG: ABC transporter ATP-binding protein [Nostoc sp.]|uniref:ABC transporter ATP-binding protein n=1 Tax=Nostoc sp. TaxID=1180 RepID=UPI002FF6C7B4